MDFELFILLLTAHMLADYVVQGPVLVREKGNGSLWALSRHVLSYWVIASFLSFWWMSWMWVLMLGVQSLLHWIIDYAKIGIVKKYDRFSFEAELSDLFLHVLAIWTTIQLFQPQYYYADILQQYSFEEPTRLFYIICLYISAISFLFRGGTSLVRKLLFKVKSVNMQAEENNLGRLIGNLERLFIFLIIVFANDLTAIGFVITAKSIARFEEIKNKQFAEYYLIGTLSSTIIAVVTGKLVLWMTVMVI